MNEDTVDLRFLAKHSQKIIEDLRPFRKEVSEVRSLALQTYEHSRRTERHQSELRDDLELTIEIEFAGGLTHLQSVLENSLARTEAKSGELAERVDALEHKP